jgi:uncharacterized protein (TIGR03084 family)
MTSVPELRADLEAEQQSLDDVVAAISNEQWRLPTPSPGWSVADQIGHLTYFDASAALAITDPDVFLASVERLAAPDADVDALTLHRELAPAALLDTWRANRLVLHDATSTLDEQSRVVWYGPPMSAKSFLTARLMECWAHGHDVVEAVGSERQPTDRLRHIAQLGFITRKWTYINRGLEPPDADIRVELTGPSGDTWTFRPERTERPESREHAGGVDRVTGPALDFCLVVTQRRNVDDTALTVVGTAARDWMAKAQAFAGGPTDPPAAHD